MNYSELQNTLLDHLKIHFDEVKYEFIDGSGCVFEIEHNNKSTSYSVSLDDIYKIMDNEIDLEKYAKNLIGAFKTKLIEEFPTN